MQVLVDNKETGTNISNTDNINNVDNGVMGLNNEELL